MLRIRMAVSGDRRWIGVAAAAKSGARIGPVCHGRASTSSAAHTPSMAARSRTGVGGFAEGVVGGHSQQRKLKSRAAGLKRAALILVLVPNRPSFPPILLI